MGTHTASTTAEPPTISAVTDVAVTAVTSTANPTATATNAATTFGGDCMAAIAGIAASSTRMACAVPASATR
ncbi:MAG: hypothetical protein INR66_23305 [Gordonia polyisoprenivorans]|nr:hypothetical protein [Gordonia polyisoprenivorans]